MPLDEVSYNSTPKTAIFADYTRAFTPVLRQYLRQTMGTVRLRGKAFKAEVCVKGERDYGTFDTEREAHEWVERREAELRNFPKLPSNATCQVAFDRYARTISARKKGCKWEALRLAKFAAHPLFQRRITEVTNDTISTWRDERLTSVSGSTVIREMNLLSHVFSTAVKDWGWIKENPCSGVRRPKANGKRNRRVYDDEIEMLRAALGWPNDDTVTNRNQAVAVGFLFAIETAMRLSEFVTLTPDQIHREDRLAHLNETKNGDGRDVMLTTRALELLTFVPNLWQEFDTPEHFGKTFHRYKNKTPIENLTFHDTRHEAITRLSEYLHVLELAKTTGHRDIKELMTYYEKHPREISKKLP